MPRAPTTVVTLLMGLLCATAPAQSKQGKKGKTAPPEIQRQAFGSSYYLLEVPPGDPKKPRGLIVMLHGSGGRPEVCVPCYHDAVAKGYLVCLPASIDPAQYDDADEKQVLAMVDDVLQKHVIDRDRILLSGHSAGAAISFFLVSQRPDLFTACAAGAAGLRFPAERLRSAAHVPFYVATGAKDFNHAECTKSAPALETVGIRVLLRDEPAWDHGLAPEAWAAMFDWFDGLVPAEQGKALRAARAACDAGTWGKAAPVLAKLREAKGTTEHVRTRVDLMLAAIATAADAELAAIYELVDAKKYDEALARLTKAKGTFAGTAAAARIDEEIAACRAQLAPAK